MKTIPIKMTRAPLLNSADREKYAKCVAFWDAIDFLGRKSCHRWGLGYFYQVIPEEHFDRLMNQKEPLDHRDRRHLEHGLVWIPDPECGVDGSEGVRIFQREVRSEYPY